MQLTSGVVLLLSIMRRKGQLQPKFFQQSCKGKKGSVPFSCCSRDKVDYINVDLNITSGFGESLAEGKRYWSGTGNVNNVNHKDIGWQQPLIFLN